LSASGGISLFGQMELVPTCLPCLPAGRRQAGPPGLVSELKRYKSVDFFRGDYNRKNYFV